MREALFIKKNKERWQKIEQEVSSDPDETAADFIQLVDDLAYAKTFYPSGKVTNYINTLASKTYLDIYRNRKEESNRILMFWKYDLPLTIRKHHKYVLVAFSVFVVFFLIAFFLGAMNEDLLGPMMGDPSNSYVDMSRENIRNKNPFGVYEGGNSILTWLGIMVNNILVALREFASGIAFGIPAIYSIAKFGAMVGAFDQIFASEGLGLDFWLVVMVHGSLEITAFILVGAAGLILGTSYLFPGTIKRLDAFKQGAKDSIKIMIGLLPIFALAAFFEGIFTRLYNNASWLTTGIVIITTLFVFWYFVIWPILLGRRAAHHLNEEEE